jgi:hypothetical protein
VEGSGGLMRMLPRIAFLLVLGFSLSWVSADTLVLRDGRRVEGTLVGVRGDSIEFEERGWIARVRRYHRADVRRIEIDEDEDEGQSIGWDDRSTRGMRERTVSVAASTAWTDTGIDVRRGQEVRFRASGKVRWGADRNDGPRGEGGNHYNANRPIPDRPGAALIGRIGEGQDVFFIGDDDGPIRVRGKGRLYLGINDDYLQDNQGSFRVIVYY